MDRCADWPYIRHIMLMDNINLYEESLTDTVNQVDELSDKEVLSLLEEYGAEIGPGHSPRRLRYLAKGFVQIDWYETVKGDVPMPVKKNQESRVKKARAPKAEAQSTEAPARRGRTPKTYRLVPGKAEELKQAKGQRALVIAAMKEVKSGNFREIGEALATQDGFTTKQSAERVAAFYINQMQKDGLVEAV